MRHVVFASLLAGSTLAGIAPALAQEGPVIVLPGAPGQPSRTIDAAKAMDIANPEYSPTDVMYLQMMIPHHQQAVVMSELAKTRASTPTVRAAADRILLSQEDEMKFMRGWLSDRGEAVAMPAGHMQHADMEKMGLASAAEMAELETLSGAAFDAMFLRLMIDHHQGAVDMTEDLLQQPGTAYDPARQPNPPTTEPARQPNPEMSNRKKCRAGFTLVEILVVIVILGLLASIVGTNVFKCLGKSEVDTARTQVISFHEAIRLFLLDHRRIPENWEEMITPNERGEAYLEQITEPPKDPWGQLYEIRPGENPNQFEVISYGPDKQSDTEDDISSKNAKDK